MSSFRYRAATREGQVVEGVLQAPSQRTALDELRRQRLVPVDVARLDATGPAGRRRSLARLPALALFTRTLATLLGAGVTLDRALAFATAQARHPAIGAAARRAHDDLRGGAAFAAALAREPRVFGPIFVAMVAAAEESGALDAALADLADHLDEAAELRAQVRSSLIYPAFMAFATAAGIAVLLIFVVPRFADLLADEGAALPLSTQLLVGLSEIVLAGGWILLPGAAAAVLAARAWTARADNRRRWHAWRLRLPLVGDLETGIATARFTRALGMLLHGGRPVLPALRAARTTVTNEAIGVRLDDAAEAVGHGRSVHAALTGTLPDLATELIAVGEESGRLDALCLRVAESFEAETRRGLRNLVAVIEPAMILFFGVLVGFVALAMLQAIYGLNRSAF